MQKLVDQSLNGDDSFLKSESCILKTEAEAFLACLRDERGSNPTMADGGLTASRGLQEDRRQLQNSLRHTLCDTALFFSLFQSERPGLHPYLRQ